MTRYALWLVLFCAFLLSGCATSPTGRRQLILFGDDQVAGMGVAAYEDLKTKVPVAKTGADSAYVACVARAIVVILAPGEGPASWEVTLFEDNSANAFALPGGKIGVHTGLLRVAENQDQLATVIGHEVGHVLARHSNERMSTSSVANLAVGTAVAVISGPASPEKAEMLGMLGGIGAEYGVILPFSRTQESEADVIGLELMARAGFDPAASVALWQNMAADGGGGVPEFLSTHPAPASRIAELEARAPEARTFYEQARAAKRQPRCR